ncbi:MAG: hypothetical protein J6Q32_02490 [Clostridia bacterium]|nr:hypothetical protein [Clostridia bacterium]
MKEKIIDNIYVSYKDVESQLNHYKKQFKNKTILCNCDNLLKSKIFKYFALNFNILGLKKLILISCDSNFCEQNSVLIDREGLSFWQYKAFKIEIIKGLNGKSLNLQYLQRLLTDGNNKIEPLMGNGDFFSYECVSFIEQADLIVNLPPLSLLSEYLSFFVAHNKKFFAFGKLSKVTDDKIANLLKNNKVWVCNNFLSHIKERDDKIKGVYLFTNI